MNDFLMLYRRGTTDYITQVSATYYYKNQPKNIPIVDVKYDGTDILKIYEDCNVVVESISIHRLSMIILIRVMVW